MGDLDICLIKEFASRPGFYDRSNPHFKDKVYNQKAWTEISNQLGYDAHLLKDRMYQLRNRYNLEKRRLDNLRLEDPTKTVRSPWPLFYHLTFLDGHIRPRRSYKSMMRRHMDSKVAIRKEEIIDHPSNGSLRYDECSNGNTEVKYETEMESEEDRTENNDNFLDPSNFLADDSESEVTKTSNNFQSTEHSSRTTNGGINVRNIETLKRGFNGESDNMDTELTKKIPRIASRFDKFDAFGKFLSASLGELTETKALELIERFTSDIVKALIENNN